MNLSEKLLNHQSNDHILRCYGYEVAKTNIVRGEGCFVYDSQDNKYLDFESGVWCAGLGHNNIFVNQVIKKQLERISHIGYRYTNEIVEEAAVAVLNSLQLPDGRCTFLSSGSEAVEFGIQVAKKVTSKPKLLTLHDSYLSAYDSASRKNTEEWYCFDWTICKSCLRSEECILNCNQLMKIPFESIGGFVFEPGNSSGLINFPPKSLIKNLVNNIKLHGGLIIVDEVTTGLGRTGAWYGFQHYNLEPDIITLGKGLGNGYPVSVVAMTNNISDQLEINGFRYAQSHQDDPMGCAIAKEVITIIHKNNLVEKSKLTGKYFLHSLLKIAKRYNIIKEVRGRGLMIAIEFHNDSKSFSLSSVFHQFLEKGFIVGYKPAANLLRFYPPLTIAVDNIVQFLESLDKILNHIGH